MRDEYDFINGVRGKYSERYKQSTNLVAIDPELSDEFPDSKSVNAALKVLVEIAARTVSERSAE